MQGSYGLCLGLLLFAPAAANAACEPSFADSSTTLRLSPSSDFDEQQIVERFSVRLRNNGDSLCSVRLGVARDLGASDSRFPAYQLSGPVGVIPLISLTGAADATATSMQVTIPAGGETSVPFDVTLRVGWGSEAGTYSQQLVYALRSEDGSQELGAQRTELLLDIPSTARIRFAGAQGADGPGMLDMGDLSQDTDSLSPPFAIRVLSTAGYQMQLVSQNAGSLVRVGGTERIPYQLTVSGQPLRLEGGGDGIRAGRHTSSVGDVHPVTIVIKPDATRHAGDYSDRVTVTVSTI